jgi:predicted glycosyltransferase
MHGSETRITAPLTVMFQAPNRIGLGHINRLSAVALAIRMAVPGARVPFVLSGNSHGFLECLGLPYVALPEGHEFWECDSWTAWTRMERRTIIESLAASVVERLQPHVVVFDCFPMLAVVRAATSRQIPLVLCLRKMRNMQAYFARLKATEHLFRVILLPHSPDEMEVPEHLRSRSLFVGTIVRHNGLENLGPGGSTNEKLVIVCGGGGGYPGTVEYYNSVLSALAQVRLNCPLQAMLVTGPLFHDWKQLRLIDGLRIIPFEPRLVSLLSTADLIICQAGYNTIAEVAELGITTICLPAPRVFDDQFERARKFAALSPNFHVYLESDLAALGHMIDSCLAQSSPTVKIANVSAPGTIRAAEAILQIAGKLRHSDGR